MVAYRRLLINSSPAFSCTPAGDDSRQGLACCATELDRCCFAAQKSWDETTLFLLRKKAEGEESLLFLLRKKAEGEESLLFLLRKKAELRKKAGLMLRHYRSNLRTN